MPADMPYVLCAMGCLEHGHTLDNPSASLADLFLTSLPRVLQLEGHSPSFDHIVTPGLAESILQVVFDSSSSYQDLNCWHSWSMGSLLAFQTHIEKFL